jgi:hypothetical protein
MRAPGARTAPRGAMRSSLHCSDRRISRARGRRGTVGDRTSRNTPSAAPVDRSEVRANGEDGEGPEGARLVRAGHRDGGGRGGCVHPGHRHPALHAGAGLVPGRVHAGAGRPRSAHGDAALRELSPGARDGRPQRPRDDGRARRLRVDPLREHHAGSPVRHREVHRLRARVPPAHGHRARRALHAALDAEVPASRGRGAARDHLLPALGRSAGAADPPLGAEVAAVLLHEVPGARRLQAAAVPGPRDRGAARERPGRVRPLPGDREARLLQLPLEGLLDERRPGAGEEQGVPRRRERDEGPHRRGRLHGEPDAGRRDRDRLVDVRAVPPHARDRHPPRRACAAQSHDRAHRHRRRGGCGHLDVPAHGAGAAQPPAVSAGLAGRDPGGRGQRGLLQVRLQRVPRRGRLGPARPAPLVRFVRSLADAPRRASRQAAVSSGAP